MEALTHADSGYQADGKPRYPIDTPEHARAAAHHIGDPACSGMYSAGHLVKVKANIDGAVDRHGVRAQLAEDELRRHREYDPGQKRDPDGKWGDGVPGPSSGGLKDTLKLAGKIDLAPDEKLLGTAKVAGDTSSIRMALTEQGGKRMLRLGVGGEGYGTRDPEMGTIAWDGNATKPKLSDAEIKRFNAELEALDEEANAASPARQQEISDRQDAIVDALTEGDGYFNGTAKLDEYSMERLASKVRPAMTEAVEQQKAEEAAWDEIEALEAKGNPDPARLAELRRIARATPPYDAVTFTEGILPGSAWGDVHYSVGLDDITQGVYLTLGVAPKDAPDDWGDGLDWTGQFDAAETKKFLRLLDRFAAPAAERSTTLTYDQLVTRATPRGAPVYDHAFESRFNDQHAPAGSSTGGQFAAGGGGGPAAKKAAGTVTKAAAKSAKAHSGGRRTPPAKTAPKDDGTLTYDPGSNHGTGYDSHNGDSRVHSLQQSLSRLGITDADGKPLKDDGRLGPKTTAAVKKLQTALGLKADGKVTPALLAQVKSMKSLPAKPPARLKKRSALMDFCVRSFGFEFEERSRSSDGRTLEGYAAVFNSPTRIAAIGGDFDEVIAHGAFTRSIRQRMPVLQFEHGRDPRVGAVPIGSIEDLAEDSQGLHVRARLFDNPVVEPVRQAIQGQAIKGMSFRFNVAPGGDDWASRSNDVQLRTVGDADVHELGPVVFPAYAETTVSIRSMLAQLEPAEHLALLHELAYDLRSVDLENFPVDLGARSAGGGGNGTEPRSGYRPPQSPDELRLQERALRALGVLQ